ncbi:hypothetical protein SAMN03159286_1074 [Enterobacter sp. NFIX58]|nr:hypothetical protein SAMN03159286_1074 [Enterobacter sp. NFIX58]
MLFSSLSFLFYSRFSGFFVVVLFSSLRFLLYSGFSGFFVVVLFSGLRFLLYSRFSGFFVVLFGSLRFLLGWCCGCRCSGFFFRCSFVVFLMMNRFCWGCGGGCSRCGSRCSSCGSVSSKCSRRQTHSSGNNQS